MSERNKRLRLRNMYDFWAEDKALLLASSPSFELAWENLVPDQDDLEALTHAYISSHSDDSAAFVLTPASLDLTIARLVREISVLWGERILEIPSVTILSLDDYHAEFSRLTRELCGYLHVEVDDSEPLCPPSVSLFPHIGRLLVAERDSLPLRSADSYVISQNPWKQRHLEYLLAHALGTSLYAQIRGDWKDPASIALNSLSSGSQYILPALLLSSSEALARSTHPEWSLQAVYERVTDFYYNQDAFRMYRFVDLHLHSLGKTRAQLAMISDFTFESQKGNLLVVFTPEHPFHDMRVRYFKEGRVGFS